MKTLLAPLAFIALAHLCVPSVCSARTLELEHRISECTRVLKEMMNAPDAGIPTDLLRRSRAIVVFPSILKAGLGIGGQYGTGMILRRSPRSGTWGPPVFLTLIGGSFGWQAGVQATDLILLVMSDVSLKSLFRHKFTLGVDASVAAGPIGRDASASADIDLSAGMLSYSRAKGLFAGVSVKGSVIEPDWQANEAYYGSELSIIDVFFKGQVNVSPAARDLLRLLNRHTK